MAERTLVGYKPYSYQRAVHNELNNAKNKGKIVVVKSRRQCGKSLMVENELLRYSIQYAKQSNAVLSPTLKQAKKMFKEIIEAVASTGIIKSANGTDLEIKFINKSFIRFCSAEQGEALRGFTVTGILCIDEACFITPEIFYTVLPWCDYFRASILITSTPKMKMGWFYEYFMRGKKGDEKIVSIDWCDKEYKEDMDKILPPEKLEEYKRILPKTIFETEYLGEFVDNGGGVFNVSEWYDNFPADFSELYIGIDWATGENGDKTAVVGLDEFGQERILEYWNNISEPMEQIRKIAGILRGYRGKIKKVLAERNSIGDTFLKLLQNEVKNDGFQIVGFDTSNDSKRDIIEGLAAALGEGNVKLLNENENKLQIGAYQAEVTKSGKITYNGSFGFNDDICIATALANKAKISNYGNYAIRFAGGR